MSNVIVTMLMNRNPTAPVSTYEIYGLPWIQRYANKFGYDVAIIRYGYIEINGDQVLRYDDMPDRINPMYYKYKLTDLFQIYDRVCFIDTDVIIRDECPDLFDIVPEDKFGVCIEDHPEYQGLPTDSNLRACQNTRNKIAETYGDCLDTLAWNAGLMVSSKQHAPIYDLSLGTMKYWGDQIQLNYNVNKLGVDLYPIDAAFNYPVRDIVKFRRKKIIGHDLPSHNEIMIFHFCDRRVKDLFVSASIEMANMVGLDLPENV